MAEITDPQVVRFSNEQVRPIADALYSLYYQSQDIIQNYITGGIAGKIEAGGGTTAVVVDGSETDGRSQITGQDIINEIEVAQAYVAFVDGGAVPQQPRKDPISKPHVRDPNW